MSDQGIIYIARNSITGKAYVGQTIQGLAIRKKSHKYNAKTKEGHFYSAIRKYGFDIFGWAILETCGVRLLDERESFWIRMLDTVTNGYNLGSGGEHYSPAPETREKLRLAGLRRGMPEGATEKAAVANRGGHHSEESKEKMRKAALGRKWSPEMKERFRVINLGNTHAKKKASA